MAAPRKAVAEAKAEVEHIVQMCAEHFPHGWKHVPAEHEGVACEHGQWNRTDPPAAPVEPERPPTT